MVPVTRVLEINLTKPMCNYFNETRLFASYIMPYLAYYKDRSLSALYISNFVYFYSISYEYF